MENEFVSVVIPTYNRAYCISRAIDSVVGQSHENWELILVDDGSTDDTAGLVSSRYGHDARVRYIFQPNTGVSAARNTGIRASRGQFIALLDSDDSWKPWKLQAQLSCFRAFPEVGMVWTEFEAIDPAGHIAHSRYLRKMYDAYRFFPQPSALFSTSRRLSDVVGTDLGFEPSACVYVGNIYEAMLRGNLVHTSTAMLSRERIEKVKEFDESLVLSGEDYDFHFRTCKWGSVCFIDVPSTTYQIGLEDRLSRHKLQIALNFLKTVQAAVDREKGTSHFSSTTVNEVLAEANSWIAEEQFKIRDHTGVRRHALLSLGHRPWQPRMLCLLGLGFIPPTLTECLLRAYRYLK